MGKTLQTSCSVRWVRSAHGYSGRGKPSIKHCNPCCMNPETAAIAKRGTAMSREALHESLSAVLDNEADELELRRVLSAEGDNEMRSTWSRYQIARAAMHKELIEPRLDIASAVSAALADEPAITAVKPQRFAWRNVGRLAVAASVTVAVLAGVRLYNQSEVAGP